jgi:superfamily II DNA or RNA helicase
MWKRYNEVYQLNAEVLSMGFLTEGENERKFFDPVKGLYRDRDFVLIDESHNFRNSDTQRYRVMQTFLRTGRKVCFLTATPRNKSANDVYSQIKLFHQSDLTDIPVDPPNLREFFDLVEDGKRALPSLLSHVLVRRTRNHILRWYGYDAETDDKIDPTKWVEYAAGDRRAYVLVAGRHQYFPRRILQTIEYSIEDVYGGLYEDLRGFLGKPRGQKAAPATPPPNQLTYARYGLWHYVRKEKQEDEPYATLKRAGANLCPLIRIMLFKRFESSVYAFRETIRRMLSAHRLFLQALEHGIVPAGEEMQRIMYDYSNASVSPDEGGEEQRLEDVLDAMHSVGSRGYAVDDFNMDRLKAHIRHDVGILETMLLLVEPITPDQDAKLQTLKVWLEREPLNQGKRLIFTEYSDTADYLYRNLNPGGERSDIEVIFSGKKNKGKIVGRFSPASNPEQYTEGEPQIDTLIATDVLSEGLNLQDADKIVNYDLHWNPVRLIQRFGRIDRIGSENDVVYGFNFLPERGIERQLNLQQKLARRIAEIHETIGEDAAILDPSERINDIDLYAIYEGDTHQLALWEDQEADEFVDLNEAEEIMRTLRKEQPTEYERIQNLRDGIRSSMSSTHKGAYVMCQAGRFQKLYLLNGQGEVSSSDVPRVLGTIKCKLEERTAPFPTEGYNALVMKVKGAFDTEVKHRKAERAHTLSISRGQAYVLRELRTMFPLVEDEDVRERISLLERAFRGPVTAAITKDVNKVRANHLVGEGLLKVLGEIYYQHRMGEWIDQVAVREDSQEEPRIICSEYLY